MKQLAKLSFFICNFSFLISLSSCSDDKEEAYPSLITELTDCSTDEKGTLSQIILDNGSTLPVTNPQTGLKTNATYRCLTGYTLEDGQATLYSLKAAALLNDSTSVAQSDPLTVVSIWRTNKYINFHLRPKTKGGQHTWGFIVESIVGRHAYIRLHHRQGSDPTAYSTDQYASLSPSLVDADQFTIHIQTFDGMKEWEL